MIAEIYEKPIYECVKPADGSWKNRHRNARVTIPIIKLQDFLEGQSINSPFNPRFYDLTRELSEPTDEELLGTISRLPSEQNLSKNLEPYADIAKYGWIGDDPRW